MNILKKLLLLTLLISSTLVSAQHPGQFTGDVTLLNQKILNFESSNGTLDGTSIGKYGGDALRIKYANNVLVFDALHNHQVHIRNSLDVTKVQFHVSGNSYFNGGNLGIGTTNPLNRFQIGNGFSFHDGSVKVIGFGFAPNATNQTLLNGYAGEIRYDQVNGKFHIGISDQSYTSGQTINDPAKIMTLNKDGNVGIGTEAPSVPLEINSFVNDKGLKIGAEGKSTKVLMFVANGNYGYLSLGGTTILRGNGEDSHFNGKLGIGTDAPASMLTIHDATNSTPEIEITSGAAQIRLGNNQGGPHGIIFGDQGSEGLQLLYRTSPNTLVIEKGNNGVGGDLLFSIDHDSEVSYFKGSIGIGTTNPKSKLAVDGVIRATEVKVLADVNVPDYVFEEDYELRTLEETKAYIAKEKHLPEIPSAAEIGEKGIDLGDMNMKLLKKIEELTLYLLDQDERMEKLENEIRILKSKK